MKKFLIFLVCIVVGSAFADQITINWLNYDGTTDQTTSCTVGGDVILPTAPTRYGYTFKGWSPPPYIQLEYIESTGTQYIDTGIVPYEYIKIETKIGETTSLVVNIDGTEAQNGIFGNGYCGARWETINGFRCGFGTDNWMTTNVSQESQNIIVFEKNNIEYNDQTVSVRLGTNFPNLTMYLFAHNTIKGGVPVVFPSKTMMYYFKVWDNGTLVANFVPAKRRSDNAIGMYDSVTGTFFENAGTGTFIAGPAVGGIH